MQGRTWVRGGGGAALVQLYAELLMVAQRANGPGRRNRKRIRAGLVAAEGLVALHAL